MPLLMSPFFIAYEYVPFTPFLVASTLIVLVVLRADVATVNAPVTSSAVAEYVLPSTVTVTFAPLAVTPDTTLLPATAYVSVAGASTSAF